MKKIAFISAFLLLFISCKKTAVLPGQSYHGAGGSYLNLSNIKWYVTKNAGSTIINLSITGNTNGDKLTMTTSGDGLLTENTIPLKSGNFTENSGIAFMVNAPASGTIQGSTQITVYKGSDTLVVPL